MVSVLHLYGAITLGHKTSLCVIFTPVSLSMPNIQLISILGWLMGRKDHSTRVIKTLAIFFCSIFGYYVLCIHIAFMRWN